MLLMFSDCFCFTIVLFQHANILMGDPILNSLVNETSLDLFDMHASQCKVYTVFIVYNCTYTVGIP